MTSFIIRYGLCAARRGPFWRRADRLFRIFLALLLAFNFNSGVTFADDSLDSYLYLLNALNSGAQPGAPGPDFGLTGGECISNKAVKVKTPENPGSIALPDGVPAEEIDVGDYEQSTEEEDLDDEDDPPPGQLEIEAGGVRNFRLAATDSRVMTIANGVNLAVQSATVQICTPQVVSLYRGASITGEENTIGFGPTHFDLDLTNNGGLIVTRGKAGFDDPALVEVTNFINNGSVLSKTKFHLTVEETYTNSGAFKASGTDTLVTTHALINNGTIRGPSIDAWSIDNDGSIESAVISSERRVENSAAGVLWNSDIVIDGADLNNDGRVEDSGVDAEDIINRGVIVSSSLKSQSIQNKAGGQITGGVLRANDVINDAGGVITSAVVESGATLSPGIIDNAGTMSFRGVLRGEIASDSVPGEVALGEINNSGTMEIRDTRVLGRPSGFSYLQFTNNGTLNLIDTDAAGNTALSGRVNFSNSGTVTGELIVSDGAIVTNTGTLHGYLGVHSNATTNSSAGFLELNTASISSGGRLTTSAFYVTPGNHTPIPGGSGFTIQDGLSIEVNGGTLDGSPSFVKKYPGDPEVPIVGMTVSGGGTANTNSFPLEARGLVTGDGSLWSINSLTGSGEVAVAAGGRLNVQSATGYSGLIAVQDSGSIVDIAGHHDGSLSVTNGGLAVTGASGATDQLSGSHEVRGNTSKWISRSSVQLNTLTILDQGGDIEMQGNLAASQLYVRDAGTTVTVAGLLDGGTLRVEGGGTVTANSAVFDGADLTVTGAGSLLHVNGDLAIGQRVGLLGAVVENGGTLEASSLELAGFGSGHPVAEFRASTGKVRLTNDLTVGDTGLAYMSIGKDPFLPPPATPPEMTETPVVVEGSVFVGRHGQAFGQLYVGAHRTTWGQDSLTVNGSLTVGNSDDEGGGGQLSINQSQVTVSGEVSVLPGGLVEVQGGFNSLIVGDALTIASGRMQIEGAEVMAGSVHVSDNQGIPGFVPLELKVGAKLSADHVEIASGRVVARGTLDAAVHAAAGSVLQIGQGSTDSLTLGRLVGSGHIDIDGELLLSGGALTLRDSNGAFIEYLNTSGGTITGDMTARRIRTLGSLVLGSSDLTNTVTILDDLAVVGSTAPVLFYSDGGARLGTVTRLYDAPVRSAHGFVLDPEDRVRGVGLLSSGPGHVVNASHIVHGQADAGSPAGEFYQTASVVDVDGQTWVLSPGQAQFTNTVRLFDGELMAPNGARINVLEGNGHVLGNTVIDSAGRISALQGLLTISGNLSANGDTIVNVAQLVVDGNLSAGRHVSVEAGILGVSGNATLSNSIVSVGTGSTMTVGGELRGYGMIIGQFSAGTMSIADQSFETVNIGNRFDLDEAVDISDGRNAAIFSNSSFTVPMGFSTRLTGGTLTSTSPVLELDDGDVFRGHGTVQAGVLARHATSIIAEDGALSAGGIVLQNAMLDSRGGPVNISSLSGYGIVVESSTNSVTAVSTPIATNATGTVDWSAPIVLSAGQVATVYSLEAATLGTSVSVTAGTLRATSGLVLKPNDQWTLSGTEGFAKVESAVLAREASLITAAGSNVEMGDNGRNDGVRILGTLHSTAANLVLRDADAVEFGAKTGQVIDEQGSPLAARLELQGTRVAASNGFHLNRDATLTGFGEIDVSQATFSSGHDSRISVSGGNLTIRGDHIQLQGSLLAGASRVDLMSANPVDLGKVNTASLGGSLNSATGFALGKDELLSGSGTVNGLVRLDSGILRGSMTLAGGLTGNGLIFTTVSIAQPFNVNAPIGSVDLEGDLGIGNGLVMVHSAGPAKLGRLTTLSGGAIGSEHGLIVGANDTLSGKGFIDGDFWLQGGVLLADENLYSLETEPARWEIQGAATLAGSAKFRFSLTPSGPDFPGPGEPGLPGEPGDPEESTVKSFDLLRADAISVLNDFRVIGISDGPENSGLYQADWEIVSADGGQVLRISIDTRNASPLMLTSTNLENNDFSDGLEGWNVLGPGSVQGVEIDTPDGANAAIEMTTGSPVTLRQNIDTGPSDFSIAFDYLFLTTTGEISVSLDGIVLATIFAPAELEENFATATFAVAEELFFNRSDIELAFTLDGLTGSQVLLDNVEVGFSAAVPEPSSYLLGILGFISLSVLAWKRKPRRQSPDQQVLSFCLNLQEHRGSTPPDHPIAQQQQDRAADGDSETVEVEPVYVANPKLGANQAAHKGAGHAQQDRDDAAARVVAGHQQLGNRAGNQTKDDPGQDIHHDPSAASFSVR